jgi:hypothetical protein
MSSSSFNTYVFVVRAAMLNNPAAEVIRSAIQQTSSEWVPYSFEPLNQIISDSLAARRTTVRGNVTQRDAFALCA